MKKQTLFTIIGIVVVAILGFVGFLILENEDIPASTKESAKFNSDFDVQPDNKQIVSQEQALSKIRLLSEVVKYEFDLKKAGKEATYEVEDGEGEWSVHVFEIVSDGGIEGHTATFGWYGVDKTSGEVRRDI